MDALGGVEQGEPSGAATCSQRPLGARRVEPQLAADEIAGVEIAEDEVRVGDRRLAPAPVAGGPRHGAGALGLDAEHAAGVDPGEGSPARADLRHVDRGDPDDVRRP